ncbi:uncharacterized protein BCR38DRAFT_414803 [Pseudomassariella vexata]|uniref:Uncharacterized protein n=1 Tax=Pseudomassariella vexata TaxID=1141098 RepID=A0A1Y2D8M7_9PEZI|nr:uncharacterized protein BCR38DRAFT_414803 [Pseudomassariella vexata]ORY55620.1 hypothetical protein BCR38DRAFT_414803 [Pseudomassariella vexata]
MRQTSMPRRSASSDSHSPGGFQIPVTVGPRWIVEASWFETACHARRHILWSMSVIHDRPGSRWDTAFLGQWRCLQTVYLIYETPWPLNQTPGFTGLEPHVVDWAVRHGFVYGYAVLKLDLTRGHLWNCFPLPSSSDREETSFCELCMEEPWRIMICVWVWLFTASEPISDGPLLNYSMSRT